jgi:hypothetical protein
MVGNRAAPMQDAVASSRKRLRFISLYPDSFYSYLYKKMTPIAEIAGAG